MHTLLPKKAPYIFATYHSVYKQLSDMNVPCDISPGKHTPRLVRLLTF